MSNRGNRRRGAHVVNGSGLQSDGPMRSLAGWARLALYPEPSFSPCLPPYCERAAAPSAGGPAAAQMNVPDCELLSPTSSVGSDLKLLHDEYFGFCYAVCGPGLSPCLHQSYRGYCMVSFLLKLATTFFSFCLYLYLFFPLSLSLSLCQHLQFS